MSSVTRPHGRHPAGVYWVRRLLVLATAFALVFGIGRMLGGSADGKSGAGDRATVAGASATTSAGTPSTSAPSPYGPVGVTTAAPSGNPTGSAPQVALAEPTGPCGLDEITVTPTITSAPAGKPVPLTLQLTGMRPACTFVVSSRSLATRVVSGKDRIWTSQQCPKSIRSQTVVVRSAAPAAVTVHWSGRRSDDNCSRSTAWALPGYYHVTAAVIGSEPADTQFKLTTPPRPIVTKTITPKPKPKAKKNPTAKATATGQ